MNRSEWHAPEQILSRRWNGTLIPGSGSGNRRGDIHTKHWVVEVKTTRGSSYTVKTSDLDKTLRYAFSIGKRPCLVIWTGRMVESTILIPVQYGINERYVKTKRLDLPCEGVQITSKYAVWEAVTALNFELEYLDDG
jgi:Holliday junction resolvase